MFDTGANASAYTLSRWIASGFRVLREYTRILSGVQSASVVMCDQTSNMGYDFVIFSQDIAQVNMRIREVRSHPPSVPPTRRKDPSIGPDPYV
ncbi:LOW QUALITY PROTEIN: hypothetical protein BC937DRAFT_93789 [Endogone sp. FLAS-F59071]|nr:LOW QUALITY PROTEIN: hypothetical protein BC937DRAFT_93789 [Endogone sp. FLAS-F59071]|eukprot:RUS21041.1 LOW QUALITY PROTEIN: hypothetical protein BC937DRAFT_93789 [Endogone sp. FLAS-F59071]